MLSQEELFEIEERAEKARREWYMSRSGAGGQQVRPEESTWYWALQIAYQAGLDEKYE